MTPDDQEARHELVHDSTESSADSPCTNQAVQGEPLYKPSGTRRALVPKYNHIFIGIKPSQEDLRSRIRTRLKKRLEHGMIAEARRLHRKGLSWKRMDELGLEYRYLAKYLQEKMSKEEMVERLNTEIWHYAKRQMTWFKRDKHIHWFEPKYKTKIYRMLKI